MQLYGFDGEDSKRLPFCQRRTISSSGTPRRRAAYEIPATIQVIADRRDAFPGQTIFANYADGVCHPVDRTSIDSQLPRIFRHDKMSSATGSEASQYGFVFRGRTYRPPAQRGWSTHKVGMLRMGRADRFYVIGNTLERKKFFEDAPFQNLTTTWGDTSSSGFGESKLYVVQTQPIAIQRCIIMASDPGDLVLDPTCGAGTTAYVAEQWGRRWITVDTSRVALALARARIMGARYPYYLLSDSRDGQAQAGSSSSAGPRRNLQHTVMFARASCMNGYPISPSGQLPTTRR